MHITIAWLFVSTQVALPGNISKLFKQNMKCEWGFCLLEDFQSHSFWYYILPCPYGYLIRNLEVWALSWFFFLLLFYFVCFFLFCFSRFWKIFCLSKQNPTNMKINMEWREKKKKTTEQYLKAAQLEKLSYIHNWIINSK